MLEKQVLVSRVIPQKVFKRWITGTGHPGSRPGRFARPSVLCRVSPRWGRVIPFFIKKCLLNRADCYRNLETSTFFCLVYYQKVTELG